MGMGEGIEHSGKTGEIMLSGHGDAMGGIFGDSEKEKLLKFAPR
jgi:hypothetical protein